MDNINVSSIAGFLALAAPGSKNVACLEGNRMNMGGPIISLKDGSNEQQV